MDVSFLFLCGHNCLFGQALFFGDGVRGVVGKVCVCSPGGLNFCVRGSPPRGEED